MPQAQGPFGGLRPPCTAPISKTYHKKTYMGASREILSTYMGIFCHTREQNIPKQIRAPWHLDANWRPEGGPKRAPVLGIMSTTIKVICITGISGIMTLQICSAQFRQAALNGHACKGLVRKRLFEGLPDATIPGQDFQKLHICPLVLNSSTMPAASWSSILPASKHEHVNQIISANVTLPGPW